MLMRDAVESLTVQART